MASTLLNFYGNKTTGDTINIAAGLNRLVVICHKQVGTSTAITAVTVGGYSATHAVSKSQGSSYSTIWYWQVPNDLPVGDYAVALTGLAGASFQAYVLNQTSKILAYSGSAGNAAIGDLTLSNVTEKANGITITNCALAAANGGVSCTSTGYTAEDLVTSSGGFSHRFPSADSTTASIAWDWTSTTNASVIAASFAEDNTPLENGGIIFFQ